MKKRTALRLSQSDFKFLLFLWKWKVATTEILFQEFSKTSGSDEWGIYQRLLRLEHHKMIMRMNILQPRPGFVWSIADKGFRLIKESLAELSEEGFKSENPVHDLHVTVCHLGPFIKNKNVTLYTEQEIRRINHSAHPRFFPDRLKHRPDGIIAVRNKDSFHATALEVELTVKAKRRYQETFELYGLASGLASVLWIVKNESVFYVMWRELKNVDQHARAPHQFVALDDYLRLSLNAEIFAGTMRGQKVQNLYFPHCPYNKATLEPQSIHTKNLQKLLDTRLRPIKSVLYKTSKKPEDSNRIPTLSPKPTHNTLNSSTKENLYVQDT